MNTKQALTPWVPLEGLTTDCYIDSVHNDENGFKVILVENDSKKRKVLINFPYGVRSYRATDELLSINAFEVDKDDSIQSDPSAGTWSLFKVTHSEYLLWASKRSSGISDKLQLQHFVIYSIEWTLEILDNADPIVEFINSEV